VHLRQEVDDADREAVGVWMTVAWSGRQPVSINARASWPSSTPMTTVARVVDDGGDRASTAPRAISSLVQKVASRHSHSASR
jgi:hypothetical protein